MTSGVLPVGIHHSGDGWYWRVRAWLSRRRSNSLNCGGCSRRGCCCCSFGFARFGLRRGGNVVATDSSGFYLLNCCCSGCSGCGLLGCCCSDCARLHFRRGGIVDTTYTFSFGPLSFRSHWWRLAGRRLERKVSNSLDRAACLQLHFDLLPGNGLRRGRRILLQGELQPQVELSASAMPRP